MENNLYKHRVTISKKSAVFLVIYLVVFIFTVPKDLEELYLNNYIVDGICLFLVVFLLCMYSSNYGFDIFDPINFITLIYSFMFFVTPMYDICTGELTWYGYNLFRYGVEATGIAFAGYIAFYLVYIKGNIRYLNVREIRVDEIADRRNLILVILVMYGVCFFANAYYMIRYYGTSLSYILTLGLIGTNVQGGDSGSIGFIGMLSYSLPTTVLLYWEYGSSKLLKIILFIPMLMMQITRGFRFFVIQIIVTFFGYYYIRKGSRPKIIQIFTVCIVMMIPVLLMTLFRDSIRAGAGSDIASVDTSSLQDAFNSAVWDNFRIYQNFYGMVGVIPSKYPFVYGRQIILGTLVMVVPRVIWPGKISSYGGYGLKILIGSQIGNGQAYPNLGEYYYAAGIFGVVFFMVLWGWLMKFMKNRFMSPKQGGLNNIIFVSLLGANLQLIIRGYMPSNFWYVVFLLIPVWIIKILFNPLVD